MHKDIFLWNCVYWKKRKCSLEFYFYFFSGEKKSGAVHLTMKLGAKEPVVRVFLLLGCLFLPFATRRFSLFKSFYQRINSANSAHIPAPRATCGF